LREFEVAFFSSHWKITVHIVAVKEDRAGAAQRTLIYYFRKSSSVAPILCGLGQELLEIGVSGGEESGGE
jgi:hypothetical protein